MIGYICPSSVRNLNSKMEFMLLPDFIKSEAFCLKVIKGMIRYFIFKQGSISPFALSSWRYNPGIWKGNKISKTKQNV